MQKGSVLKLKKETGTSLDLQGDLFYILEFAFPLKETRNSENNARFILTAYYGIDQPLGILNYILAKDEVEEYFEIYKTQDKIRQEYFNYREKYGEPF